MRGIRHATLLFTALAAVTLGACSEENSIAEPITMSSDIYIRGVPLGKMRALGWSPEHTADYDAAAIRFSTREACLVSNPDEAKSLTIDWSEISSDPEAEVCLSRVASSIGSAKGIVAWLNAHGFEVVDVRTAGEGDTSVEAIERTGIVIDGTWSIEKHGPLYRGWGIAPVTQRLFANGASVTIFVSTEGKMVSTRAGATYL